MAEHELHAVIYRDATSDQWMAECLEYQIATQGDSEEHPLEMIREAWSCTSRTPAASRSKDIDNEIGSEPMIMRFLVRAPAIVDR